MWLTVLYLFHEYMAKNIMPNYKTLFEAREAANRLYEIYENQPEAFYELSSPLTSSLWVPPPDVSDTFLSEKKSGSHTRSSIIRNELVSRQAFDFS